MLVARGYKQCVHVNNWGTTSPEGGQNVLGQVAACPRTKCLGGHYILGG